MPHLNERWAARVLGMRLNSKNGPDLIDEYKTVEVKFKLQIPEWVDPNVKDRNYISWRVLDHQVNYNLEDSRPFYFLLGVYQLSQKVSDIPEKISSEDLEGMVIERQGFIVVPEWVKSFQTYVQTGKTQISEWQNQIKFPKKSMLPKICKVVDVEKGKIHFTEGADIGHFDF